MLSRAEFGMDEKLRRAGEHCETIRAIISDHFARYPDGATAEIDADGKLGFYGASDPAPTTLSVVIGDCVHNLRSALDHLANALVVANHRTPNKSTTFPILAPTRNTGSNAEDGRLAIGWADDVQSYVTAVQPITQLGADFELHDLWILHALWNQDKHRSIAVVQVAGFGHHSYPSTHQPTNVKGAWHRERNDECDAVFVFVADNPALDVSGEITLDVVLGAGPGGGHRVQWLMDRLQTEVTRIVSNLSTFLPD